MMKNWTSKTTRALSIAALAFMTGAARAGEYNTAYIGTFRAKLTRTVRACTTHCLEPTAAAFHSFGRVIVLHNSQLGSITDVERSAEQRIKTCTLPLPAGPVAPATRTT